MVADNFGAWRQIRSSKHIVNTMKDILCRTDSKNYFYYHNYKM